MAPRLADNSVDIRHVRPRSIRLRDLASTLARAQRTAFKSLARFYDSSVTEPAFLMTHLHYVWPKRTDVAAAVPAIVNFYVSIIWSARRGAEILKPLVGTRLSRARCISKQRTDGRTDGRSRARNHFFHCALSCSPASLSPSAALPPFFKNVREKRIRP